MPSIKSMFSGEFGRLLFLNGIIVGFGGIAGIVLGIPLIGYVLTPLIRPTPRVWRDVGAVSDFQVGTTVEVRYSDPGALQWAGTTTLAAAWLRCESHTQFIAYSIYCTHLGCPVHWLPTASLFLCPCHGSAFYKDGSVAAGPAQTPLVHLPVRVRGTRVEIKTSPVPAA